MNQRHDNNMARYEADKLAFAKRLNLGLGEAGIPERGRAAELQRRLQSHPQNQDTPSLTAIRKWLDGDSLPEVKRLGTLSDIIGKSVTWMLTGKDNPLEQAHGHELPILSYVQAGALCSNGDVPLPDQCDERIVSPVKVGPNAYALRVRGDSMVSMDGRRSYPEGTVIIVDPDVQHDHGRRVVARIGDETTFKELVRDTGAWFLRPLNPQYRMIELGPDSAICGVVVCAIQIE